MKTKEKKDKLEFTRGNSKSPLPAGSSADVRPDKDEEKKNKERVDRERKRVAEEEEVKREKRKGVK